MSCPSHHPWIHALKVTGGWRKLNNEELHNLYSSPSFTFTTRPFNFCKSLIREVFLVLFLNPWFINVHCALIFFAELLTLDKVYRQSLASSSSVLMALFPFLSQTEPDSLGRRWSMFFKIHCYHWRRLVCKIKVINFMLFASHNKIAILHFLAVYSSWLSLLFHIHWYRWALNIFTTAPHCS
jgi:hypothetical protein